MTRKFVQTPPFVSAWKLMRLDDNALFALQDILLLNPEDGDMIEGTGGARKTRIQLIGRGKSGGGRVIYFDTGEVIYLLTAYPKNVQEDLSPLQKKRIHELTRQFREE